MDLKILNYFRVIYESNLLSRGLINWRFDYPKWNFPRPSDNRIESGLYLEQMLIKKNTFIFSNQNVCFQRADPTICCIVVEGRDHLQCSRLFSLTMLIASFASFILFWMSYFTGRKFVLNIFFSNWLKTLSYFYFFRAIRYSS